MGCRGQQANRALVVRQVTLVCGVVVVCLHADCSRRLLVARDMIKTRDS